MIQLLISGISLGSVYALIAVGFAIVFSILRFSNFAHGGMISACAFIGYFFQASFETPPPFYVTVLFTAACGVVMAAVIDLIAYRRIRKKQAPTLYYFLASITIAILIEQILSVFFGKNLYGYPQIFESTTFHIGSFRFSSIDTLILVVSLVILTVLKLLGREFSRIAIYDPNEALCRRYALELNQVLSPDGGPLPEITICPEDELFDCDLFLFTASRGVPPVGAEVKDVRMAQFARNREMLDGYAARAREVHFGGLFCQISDPVDLLCRSVFLRSNRDGAGRFDAVGLLPEQIRGFGLGVMAARAAYYAKQEGVDFSEGRVYGPHGAELIVADHPQNYDAARSARLTERTVEANLRVRELGFKPYIAPALSSAAVSLLRLLRGETCFSAVPMGAAYFGCRSRMTEYGIRTEREPLHPALLARIREVHRRLEQVNYD